MSFKNAAVLLAVMIAAAGCKSTGSYGYPDRGAPFLKPTSARPAVAAPKAAAAVRRERVVEVNPLRLSPPQNQRIELPLFDDTRLEAVGVRTERQGKGFVWIGQLRDEPLSLVVLSVQGDAVAGNIFTGRGDNYEIRPVGRGLHIVRQLDPSTFAVDDIHNGPSSSPLAQPSPVADPCGGTDPGADIDVLIAYTTTARVAAGGVPQMEALIYGAVALTNQTYINSGITQRMRIVNLREVSYTETGNSCTDVTRMQNTSDGFLDGLLAARDAAGADLVLLMVDGALVSTTTMDAAGNRTGCGGASFPVNGEVFNILNPNNTAWEINAYGVFRAGAATANLTFPHEAGHLMGARHAWATDSTNNSPFVDNHGFFNSAAGCGQRSVMATSLDCGACTRIPFWSNPGTTRCSAAFGVAAPTVNAANNVNALNTSRTTVANFRCSSPGRTDVWMRDTWDDTGAQPDPATASQAMWRSPYIWIRTAQDVGLVNQHDHQNPALNASVFAYVKLHNGSGGTASGNVELYWSHTSTGLAFPGTWNLIGSVPVAGFAPSTTRIVEFPWTTPASAPSGTGHFCLVARWVSAADPSSGGTTDINTLVRNNNNMVWRNLDPLGTTGDPAEDVTFIVRNLSQFGKDQGRGPLTLRVAPIEEEANGSFFFYARGVITLGDEVHAAWRRGGARGSGFRELADGRLEISDPDGAVLENIELPGEGTVRLELIRNAGTPKRKFNVEATQYAGGRVVGGVTYELPPP
ncbi:MAG: hypothetical protein QOI24_1572 [Acidobacteriota bacterium]|jgi:hypothetical protein|nr:hypothetical protein [Acidobacteriota bacterium]